MDTRLAYERRDVLSHFWESKISSLMKLKPSELIQEADTTTIAQGMERPGVLVPDVQAAWQKWTSSYTQILDLFDKELGSHAPEELAEIYGARPGEPPQIPGVSTPVATPTPTPTPTRTERET